VYQLLYQKPHFIINTMSGWEVRFSNSKQVPYFFNAASGQSVWEKPGDLSDDQVAQLPGAKYLSGGGGGDAGKPKQVRSSHILAKHAGSRRPSSWRQVSSHFVDIGERRMKKLM
jgi:NIMA-interacting peptidyl-prolyl cis-trans isomerase 1